MTLLAPNDIEVFLHAVRMLLGYDRHLIDTVRHQRHQVDAGGSRHREVFAREQDHMPDTNWGWLNTSREALRQILGFFIGEPPVNPLDTAATTAAP